MSIPMRRAYVLFTGVVFSMAFLACGGSLPPPETEPGVGGEPQTKPLGTTGIEVEIYTGYGRFVVNEFRIDFEERRNILQLFGFYPDQWERMEQVPLSALEEFEIRSIVDDDSFARVYKDRRDFQLNQQEIFRVFLRMKGGNIVDYIAIIPRIRGFRDGQRWEQSMSGNPLGVQRIVIKSSLETGG
jgi:hypothetical protein